MENLVEGQKKTEKKPRSAGRRSQSREMYLIRSTCQGCGILFASPKGKKRHMRGNKEGEVHKHVMADELGPIRQLGKVSRA